MFVYTITNTVNGRVYVGKSVMPATRWSQHKHQSLTATGPLYVAMRKHGVAAFEFTVVEECPSEAESYDAEQRWIVRLDSTVDGHGYNQRIAKGTRATSFEVKRKRASASGKKLSPEHVAKIAAANRGQKRTREQIERLSQSDHRYRHITAKACWKLYSRGLSCREVARVLGCDSERPVARLLKTAGYNLRSAGHARVEHVTAENCWELYSKGLSLDGVAARLGCNKQLVFRRLRNAGYQIRDAVQSHLRLVGSGH